MELVYPVCNFIQKTTLRSFADWNVIGRENVPPKGPLIIVANHQSNTDPSLLATSIPRRTWFLAKEEVFRGSIAAWFFRQYGAFPVNREGTDVRAYRWALSRLEHNQALVVFPEGTRSRGGMKKAQDGVTRLALRSLAPLLPVGVTGTERLGSPLRVFTPTGKIMVNIGPVFSLPSFNGRPDRRVQSSLTDMIMERIAALLPESYQGVYRPRGREAGAVPGDDGMFDMEPPGHN